MASQQRQQGRWLQWQRLLLCPLYIFFRPPICKPPSVPLHLRKCSSIRWLQGARVSSARSESKEGRGAAITECRLSLHHLSQLPAEHAIAAENTPGEGVLPSNVFHQHSHSLREHLCLLPYVVPNSPLTTHCPACHLTPLTLSEIRQWFSDTRCQLGQILSSLFTLNCAVGGYSPREINGIMNTK